MIIIDDVSAESGYTELLDFCQREIARSFSVPEAILKGADELVVMCAVCQKPVDRIEKSRDELTCCDVYTVWCHGETDRCEFPDEARVDIGPNQKLTRGEAFTNGRKRVEND